MTSGAEERYKEREKKEVVPNSRPTTSALAPDEGHPHWHYLEPRLPASLPGSGRASGLSGHNTTPRASSGPLPPPPTPPLLPSDFQVLSSAFVHPPIRPRARENDARAESERKRGKEEKKEREGRKRQGGREEKDEDGDVRHLRSKERLIFHKQQLRRPHLKGRGRSP